MKKLKALIIDDEPKLQKVLQMKLEKYCPSVGATKLAGNITDGFELARQFEPNLVFLDISMPGGSGFEFLDQFETIDFEIIFVTGFDEYVLNAIKVSAVDYLLKPVSTEELVAAVRKAEERIEEREKIERYHVLQHNLNHIGNQEAKIAIPGGSTYDFVKVSDIIRCEGWQKYTKIHLLDGSCIVSSYNIGVFKKMLESYEFFSTHKSHLINTKLISKYLKEGFVVMEDQSEVPISRRKRDEFLSKVLNYF
ncbi:MAG: LytTR family DNA-binding domain-containing protein [Saprospiraceae bacterium]|nr:LytTR family DNA-binding domain-containing protein [Saprospiraceae bacterium]